MGQTVDDVPDMTPAAQRDHPDARTLASPIGFVGLGVMGLPMAQALLRAGHQLVVCDTDPSRLAMIAGSDNEPHAHTTTMATELGAQCAVVFMMLPDSLVVAEVTGMLADSMPSDGLLVDLGFSEPEETRLLAQALATRGLRLVDAPATGDPAAAAASAVTFFVGGAESDVAALAPLLAAMGTLEMRTGSVGSAHAAVRARLTPADGN